MKINYVLTVSSGHVALVLFVLVILIGIRARFAGNGRIGQDNAWIVHTVLGWAAILLVFLHVFFAAKIFPKYLPRLKDLLLCKVEKYKNPMIFTYIVVALAFLATLRRTPHKMKLQHDSKWWKRALGYIAGTVPWAVWFVPHILLWAYLPLVYKHVAPEKGIHPLRPLSVAMLLLVGGMFILRVIFRFFWPISRVTKVTPLSDNGELMLLDVILPSRGF